MLNQRRYSCDTSDIVVFHQTGTLDEDKPIVKRVIAVEGETVDIDLLTMKVSVTDKYGNTRVLDEPYAFYYPNKRLSTPTTTFPCTVPEGHVFVMGDNRFDSLDSRYREIGCVDERRILGKVVFRVYPFDKLGFVD